jgi:hypothetical protein
MLSDKSWPDVGVEFETALLAIENKVQPSAVREGQIEPQNDLGLPRQGTAPFFHCVLCPDYLVDAVPEPSSRIRKFPYSVLADILSSRLDACTPDAKPIVEQYVRFIRESFGAPRPQGIRRALGGTIARRNAARQPWDWAQILDDARPLPLVAPAEIAYRLQETADITASVAR